MKKIFSKVAFIAAFTIFATGATQAAPYTFQFEIPQWSDTINSPLFGNGSILRVTADNGATNTANQAYMNSQITNLAVQAIGGTFNHSWALSGATPANVGFGGNAASQSYVTTDANGIPTLNLLASSNDVNNDYMVTWDNAAFVQLGILGNLGGSTSYAVYDMTTNQVATYYGIFDGHYSGFAITGQLVDEQAVPEPASVALIGLGLMGVGAIRRRKTKTNAG